MNFINLLKFIFLGFVQGFTEPIPVSSSGHLLIFQKLLSGNNLDVDFSLLATLTNFGSLVAIIILFRKEIGNLFKGFFGYLTTKKEQYKDDYKYCWLVVIATIPAGIMGIVVTKLGLFDKLEENVKFVGATLLITALFLYLIKRDTAFNFSFILYIPISIATTILGISDLFKSNLSVTMWIYYLTATLVAGIITYFATKWFRNIVKNGKLIYFVIYCVIVGLLTIIFL